MTAIRKCGQSSPWGLLAKVAAKVPVLLKVTKLALAGASLAAYTYLFTWQFSLVICGMLVIHEAGHLHWMKRYGMKTKGIYLIPFFGAAAVADDRFPSRRAEAVIALAGPVTGGLLAVSAAVAWFVTRDSFLAAVASWMALVNLFNLLPVVPLDGGRVMKSVTCSLSTRIGTAVVVAGFLAGAALAVTADLWIFVILVPLGVLDYFADRWAARRGRRRVDEANAALREIDELFPALPPSQPHPYPQAPKQPPMGRGGIALAFSAYAALAAGLWVLMTWTASVPGAAAAMHALQG